MDDLRNLQMRFDLTPALAQILLLLVNREYVTREAIETEEKICKSTPVCVMRLRRKLERDGIEIKSRRGVGYWLEEAQRKRVEGIMRSSRGGRDEAAPPTAS